jgi:UDP-glucose 6-dehydrogenase
VDGAAIAYAGGSSSSQNKEDAIEKHDYSIYDASMSKYSGSSTSTEALPAAAELEEAILSTRFLFLSITTSSANAGRGDVDELASSFESSISSSS